MTVHQINPAIVQAMRALADATPKARLDPSRPVYHFLPPARWMNDINGPICYKENYHIFYQHNPFGDRNYDESITDRMVWAPMHWGHARSSDLTAWEHMPIALAPSSEKGEKSCWSGCAAINGQGRPMLFYTAVFENEIPYEIPFEQWAALGNEDLSVWEKTPDNPVLTIEGHGGSEFSPMWRDPFVFQAEGRTFMIIGACEAAGTPVYEARDKALTRWEYKGKLWDKSVECPNFVQLGEKWVFISSPFHLVTFDTGTFDIDTLKFVPEVSGTVDWGHYYGTNTLVDNKGRCILFGWIPGWDPDTNKSGRGWNGCMSLPRVLSLDSRGRLIQRPATELVELRILESHIRKNGIPLEDSSCEIERACGDTLEIIAEFAVGNAAVCGIRLRPSSGTREIATMYYERQQRTFHAAGVSAPLPEDSRGTLKFQVFIDKSVIEIFVNDGKAVVTRMLDSACGDLIVETFAEGGIAELSSIDIWKMKPSIPRPVG